jgi:hypothetical protein
VDPRSWLYQLSKGVLALITGETPKQGIQQMRNSCKLRLLRWLTDTGIDRAVSNPNM